MSFNMADYVDVRQRVQLFHAKYPEGSLRFEFKGICEHNPEFIWGIAYAYRTPDDPAPAQGTAQELAVGRTNFTKGSEVQNLETSCWGRAISALGLGIDKGIASADEVRFAQERQQGAPPQREYSGFDSNPMASPKQIDYINRLVNNTTYVVEYWKHEEGLAGALNAKNASRLIEYLQDLEHDMAGKTRLFMDAKKWHEGQSAEPEYDPWASTLQIEEEN